VFFEQPGYFSLEFFECFHRKTQSDRSRN
jgi:hypothetical protein